MEQFGIAIRYIKDCEPLETLIDLIKCPVVTREASCQKISGFRVSRWIHRNAEPILMVELATWLKIVPQTHYYHCTSHSLNLSLSKACKVLEVQNMMSTLQILAIFFKYSPKRHRRLEQSTEEINIQRKREGLKEVGEM